MPATLERQFMDAQIEQKKETDYISNPRKTLETLANLHRLGGMRPEQSDQLAEILRVVSEVTRQIDIQKQNESQLGEASSKAV
jgi:hypothetical protein